MKYQDRWATNEQGEKFVFTVEMQRRLDERGLPLEPENLSELGPIAPPPTDRADREQKPERVSGPEKHVDFKSPETIQIDPQTGKYIGRMKWYNVRKGFGFIVRGGGEEIFFHKSGATFNPEDLQEGQWVLYDVEETHKGPEATDVEPYAGNEDLLA